ncbi:MAG: hypothetical protein NVS2B11_07090 [Acetobacteraceae bacterium]
MSESSTVSPMPKRAHAGKLSEVKTLQDAFGHPDFMHRIKQATPKHMSPDRMLAVFVQCVQKTPKLMACNMMSLLGAFLAVASVGLEPNTALQHAHLIPFDKRGKDPATGKWGVIRTDVQIIFGYQGLLELAYRSGQLRSVHADVVWRAEAEKREHWDCWFGSGGKLIHRPMLNRPRVAGELPVLTYMHANMLHEGEAFEVMTIEDVLAIRDNSQGYKAAVAALEYWKRDGSKGNPPPAYTEAPWVRNPVPMIRKTVFRAGSKWLPKSIELAAALDMDEKGDRESLDFGSIIEGSADVLTGGVEALPDDTASRMDIGLGGDFTGYGQRAEPEPVRSAPSPAPRAAAARQPAAAPAFEGYLIDAEGEITSDLITDPGRFAEAYADLWQITENRAQLAENNAEAIAALQAYPNAASLLAGLPAPGDEPASLIIPLVSTGRGVDVTGWIKTVKTVLPTLTAEQMPEWIAANQATWRPFPSSRRLDVEKAVAERCAALGLKWGVPAPPSQ